MKTQQIHLIERPDGKAKPRDFALVEADLLSLKPNQVLVQNICMSIDPYMRRSMDPIATDLEPWPLNAPLNGPSIGRVIDSRNDSFNQGDIVESMSGWQEHFISDGDEFVPYISADTAIAKRQIGDGIMPKDYLGLLGIAAQTGYFGIACGADPKAGETLVVSSGAGTVGSVAAQVGKNKGMRVVSSTGADEKVSWLKETVGLDHVFNYKTTSISEGLAEGCPDGIDLVLENASPEHLSACFPLMNEGKLALIAGMISVYSTGGIVRNISNFEEVLDKFLTVRSYAFMEFLDAYDQFVSDMVSWRENGKLHMKETVYSGLEKAPEALCSLFNGTSFGKNLVSISD